jgi:DNA-binding Lrp family transcriptional regulator
MSWGAINAALNRLVSDGVITGFKTNLADRKAALALHVIVQAENVSDAKGAEAVRKQVMAVLDDLGEDATVTVDRSGAALHEA